MQCKPTRSPCSSLVCGRPSAGPLQAPSHLLRKLETHLSSPIGTKPFDSLEGVWLISQAVCVVVKHHHPALWNNLQARGSSTPGAWGLVPLFHQLVWIPLSSKIQGRTQPDVEAEDKTRNRDTRSSNSSNEICLHVDRACHIVPFLVVNSILPNAIYDGRFGFVAKKGVIPEAGTTKIGSLH